MLAVAERSASGALRTRLAVWICTLLAYCTALHGPFQFDDFGVIVRYEPVHSFGAWWAALGHGLRPLLKLTYAANWQLGLGALGFHLTNLAIHLLNVELVMRLYIAASQRESRWPFTAFDRGAVVAGVLFAVHPIQTEAVTYISGRSSSLSTTFVLLALLLYAGGVRGRGPWLWAGLAPVAYIGAVLTKESCAALPLGLLVWELCIEHSRGRELLRRQIAWWALLACLFAIAIMNRSYFTLLYHLAGARPLLQSFWYQIAGAGYLLSRLVLVHRLSIDPALGLHSPALVPTALCAALLCAMLYAAIVQRRARPVVAFGLAWFLIEAFVPYVLLPRPEVLNERHMYLAAAGIFPAAAALWVELMQRAPQAAGARVAFAAFVALLIAGSVHRNLDYRSATALWQSTVNVSPDSPRAQNNLGICLEANGRDAEARDAYTAALVLEPRYESARQNLERVLRRMAERTAR